MPRQRDPDLPDAPEDWAAEAEAFWTASFDRLEEYLEQARRRGCDAGEAEC